MRQRHWRPWRPAPPPAKIFAKSFFAMSFCLSQAHVQDGAAPMTGISCMDKWLACLTLLMLGSAGVSGAPVDSGGADSSVVDSSAAAAAGPGRQPLTIVGGAPSTDVRYSKDVAAVLPDVICNLARDLPELALCCWYTRTHFLRTRVFALYKRTLYKGRL